MIRINKNIFISEEELIFKASRSSGPGGQNVNKLNSRITLFFNINDSNSFSEKQKKLISNRLSKRINKGGVIRVASQKFRTQKANRNACIEKLQNLLAESLKIKPIRIETKVPYSAKQRRLDEKKRRSRLKQQRSDKEYDF